MIEQGPRKHGSTILPPALRRRREAGPDPELTKPAFVRVKASEEKYRKALRHGITKQRFMPDINTSVEWPNDVFTARRLREGSVVLDEESKQRVDQHAAARDRQMHAQGRRRQAIEAPRGERGESGPQ